MGDCEGTDDNGRGTELPGCKIEGISSSTLDVLEWELNNLSKASV